MALMILMLSLGPLKLGQEAYYLNLARDDYYTRVSAEPSGFWIGEGATELGLRG